MIPEELLKLYTNYLADANRAEMNRKPGDGLFGLGKTPADDPCHDRFGEQLDAWLKTFVRTSPDSAVIRDVLHYIYHAPKEHPEPKSSYWMLVAVHGLTRDLIPLLNPADASALAEDYTALYPRRERFPAQKQVLSALEKTAKQ